MSDTPDLSTLFSMLSNTDTKINPEELLQTFLHSSNSNDHEKVDVSTEETSTSSLPDMETIMKLMQILKYSRQDNPSKDLLKSLKPFLKDSRKEKVDQYIRMIGLTKAFELFNELGDNPK